MVAAGRHDGRPLDDGRPVVWTTAGEPRRVVGDTAAAEHLGGVTSTTVDDAVATQRPTRVDLHLQHNRAAPVAKQGNAG